MKQSLRSAIQKRFESERIDDDRLRALNSMLIAQPVQPASRISRSVLLAGLGAFALFIMSVMFLAGPGLLKNSDGVSVMTIAEEVAINHLHHKPLESTSSDIDTVNDFFDGLGLRLAEPSIITQRDWRLQGGRYCSIQGVTAAQLRYSGKAASEHTVYQAPYVHARHGMLPNHDKGEQPVSVIARGVHVTLWVQGGTLYAIASNIDHAGATD